MLELEPKKRRIVKRDVDTLFSYRAFLSDSQSAETMRLSNPPPIVRCKHGTFFLSKDGIQAVARLTETISDLSEFRGLVSNFDIENQILTTYIRWLDDSLVPTGQEFIDDVANILASEIKEFKFLAKVEGLEFDGINTLELSSVFLQQSTPLFFDKLNFPNQLNRESIYSQFKDSLWMIGVEKGSCEIASKRFDHRAIHTIGILGICGSLLYKGSISQSKIRVLTSPQDDRKAVTTLRWNAEGEFPTVDTKWSDARNLRINAEQLVYLKNNCFLNELSKLIDLQKKTELHEAIIKSIYWYSEAYRDRTPIMQFVKLWTCVESFFAIGDGITELNAKGVTTVLAFAGYKVIEVDDYSTFKRRIKHLYKLRSKAIHRAEFNHIEASDLNDFSYWVALLVISMVALAENGYETLKQVGDQTHRLDGQFSVSQ